MEQWIWFAELFGYGSDKPRMLLEQFSSLEGVLQASEAELAASGILSKKELSLLLHPNLARAKDIYQTCQQKKIKVMCYADPCYPQRLREIYAPPMVLYYLGQLGQLDEEPAVAVVGTRNATTYGTAVTERLCGELSSAGMTIISGCAVGVDAAAHYGALKVNGRTIGVLGCGLDINYPAQNRELKRSILRKGVLMTELPPGQSPYPAYFPIRNRLMAGLANSVIVAEAPKRSGSLITAHHALEQGKDVYCIPPHNIYDSRYLGVSSLIHDGAFVLCSAQEILEDYLRLFPDSLDERQIAQLSKEHKRAPRREKSAKAPAKKEQTPPQSEEQPPVYTGTLSDEQQRILSALKQEGISVDDLSHALSMPVSDLLMELTILEMEGLAESLPGNRFSRSAWKTPEEL